MKTIEEQSLIQYEKLRRLPSVNKWTQSENPNKLKTQIGFIEKVKEIKKEYKIPNNAEKLQTINNPIELMKIEHSLTIDENENFKKHDVAPTVAKAKALETIHTQYPAEQWLHVYTDGSMQDPEKGAGAGITCDLFAFYKGLGPHTTNYDGEIEAIKFAIQQLLFRTHKFNKVVILSDSKAAIQAIVSMDETPTREIQEIRKMLQQLKSLKKQVNLQWIPAHCGIHGNETADILAKKGTEIISTQTRNLPFQSAKRLINLRSNHQHKNWLKREGAGKKWKDLIDKPEIIPELPRKTAVANFRLMTGHDCLAQHLHRIGCKDTPICPLCNLQAIMNAEHLLICPGLSNNDNLVAKYWDARGKMT